MQIIRWGIISTGNIANRFAHDLLEVDSAEIVAVGSRTQTAAEKFGDIYNIPKRYDNYEDVANDPEVDIVYVATPHSMHHANTIMCLNAGKHVLCEKPLCLNAEQAEDVINLARTKNLYLMEAVWMRFFPTISKVRDWIRTKRIGELRSLRASFDVNFPYDPDSRVFDPDLGGGALLDIGIYPINLAVMILGLPIRVLSKASRAPNGVDVSEAYIFDYADGRQAVLHATFQSEMPSEAFVGGTRGYIKIHNSFWRPSKVSLTCLNGESEEFNISTSNFGYQFEIEAVHADLQAGRSENKIMPLDETLAILRLMDDLRADWALEYPQDKKT